MFGGLSLGLVLGGSVVLEGALYWNGLLERGR